MFLFKSRSIRQYLRPNFSNHPLNYIFTALVFLFSFLLSSNIKAESYFEGYTPGSYWTVTTVNGGGQGSTPCGAAAEPYPLDAMTGGGCFRRITVSSCSITQTNPNGSVVVTQTRRDQQMCGPREPNFYTSSYTAGLVSCGSESGTTRCPSEPPEVPNHCPEDGTVAGHGLLDPSISTVGQYAGCRIVLRDADLNCTEDMYCEAVAIFEYDGEMALDEDAIDPDSENIVTPQLGSNVDPNSTETTVFSDSEILPDGTHVKTDTTVTVETRGKGTDRQETETTTVVKMSNGITRTTTETVTETVNPDGSKTVTTETNIAYTGHPITTHVIDKSTMPPTHTQSSTEPKSSETTTTNTKTYDSEGKFTGENTTTTSSGGNVGSGHTGSNGSGNSGDDVPGEDEEDECQGSDCDAPGYDESGSWWETSYPDGIAGIFESHKEALLGAAMIGTITDTSGIASSGAFPLFTFPGWSIGPMSMPAKQLELDARVAPFMRVAFLFVAAVVCRRLIFGG